MKAAPRVPFWNSAVLLGVVCAALSVIAPRGASHELISTKLTWTEHIARIFYKRCAGCHREGGEAPMPLMKYAQVRPWATAIKYAVLERRMPPWPAVKGYGAFRNDLGLSQEEIALISSWAEGGAPEGNFLFLPAEPDPEDLKPEPPPAVSGELALRAETRVKKGVMAVGIRPEGLPEGGSIEVRAHLPNGAVRELIWLRNDDPRWQRSYFFREAAPLPAGAVIRVFGAPEARAVLLLGGA